MRHIAIYLRVSTRKQDTKSQEPDLKQWSEAYGNGTQIKWYRDKVSGKTMDRPGWKRLESAIDSGKVVRVVVWRLDRLGRTASGLTTLFDKLVSLGVGLTSIKDGLDITTPAGRLIANVLASVAAYENEVRSEESLLAKRWHALPASGGVDLKGDDESKSPTNRLRQFSDCRMKGPPKQQWRGRLDYPGQQSTVS